MIHRSNTSEIANSLFSIVLSSAGEGTLPQQQINQAQALILLAILEEERDKLAAIPEELERVDTLIRSIYPDFARVAEEVLRRIVLDRRRAPR